MPTTTDARDPKLVEIAKAARACAKGDKTFAIAAKLTDSKIRDSMVRERAIARTFTIFALPRPSGRGCPNAAEAISRKEGLVDSRDEERARSVRGSRERV